MEFDEIINRELTITVVGLGYVGLPAALAFHELGFKVNGIDISERVIESLHNGVDPLVDSTSELSIPVNSENWNVTSSYGEEIKDSDVIIITVPTPVNSSLEPNLEFIESAANEVINIINDDRTVVILESTVFPGVTRRIIGGLANDLGKEIVLAYCPERVSPGDSSSSVNSVSRVLGCDDEEYGAILAQLYSEITSGGCTYVGKIEVAETAKLIENVQRDIDIAFANELAIVLPGIGVDVEDVLKAASTKWNFHRHTPGIGVGGHCIPVDPYYYISFVEKMGGNSMISKSARAINRRMPEFASKEILEILEGHRSPKSLVLGFSYKPELGDCRETPVLPLILNLLNSGVRVTLFDPIVSMDEIPEGVEWTDNPIDLETDLVILATAHESILNLNWAKMLERCSTKTVYDGRRRLNKSDLEEMGWEYRGVGVPK